MRAKVVSMKLAMGIFRDRGYTTTIDAGGYRQLSLKTPYEETLLGPRMNYTEYCKAATLILAAGLK